MIGWFKRLVAELSKPCAGRAPNIPCLYCDCERIREYYTAETQQALQERKLPQETGYAG